MPSFWSSVAKSEWNSRCSNRRPSCEAHLGRAIDSLLGHQHGRKGQSGDRLGGAERLGQQVRGRNHAGHESGALGLGRTHDASREDEVHGLGGPTSLVSRCVPPRPGMIRA